MGDRLNAALNSSCVIATSSRASVCESLPASTARGANSGTLFGRVNETFHGHTSWEMYRQNRFAIPLGTGARTLRSQRS
jgi:hypothetical protein